MTYTVTLTLTEADLDQLCRGSISSEIQDALLSTGLIGELLSARIALNSTAAQNARRAAEKRRLAQKPRTPAQRPDVACSSSNAIVGHL